MKLSQKRQIFSERFANLILFINTKPGHRAAIDEVKRGIAQAAAYADEGIGSRTSNHLSGLAGDVIIYRDGHYLTDTEDYRFAGEFWKSLSTDDAECCWGGDFEGKPDGNHFSLEHEGRK